MCVVLLLNKKFQCLFSLFLWIFAIITITNGYFKRRSTNKIYEPHRQTTPGKSISHKVCTNVENILKARHRSCFLRPDTGPCRADIIQWYYDPKQHRCYRFYWGGCQGNGNRFETKQECKDYCFLNATSVRTELPYFCSLMFEYGDCFGYFHRWGYDKFSKTCKRYMYSGCGGNQNNFQSNIECMRTCISLPNNTLQTLLQHTTCMPVFLPELQ